MSGAHGDTPSISREQFLEEVARPSRGALARRPDDGWIRADPWPMGPGTRRALRGLIEVLIPPPPAPRPADMVDRIEAHVRFTMPYMPRFNAHGVVLLLWLLELSPLWRFTALGTLSRIDREVASRILKGLTHSRLLALRQLVLALKAIILPAYFDQDEVHVALRYDPSPFMKKRVALRRRLKAGEQALEDDTMGFHSKEIRG